MFATILSILYVVIVLFIPITVLMFVRKWFWKHKLHQSLYQASCAVKAEEFSFQAGRQRLDMVAQKNNLGNKIIVSKHLYEQAEDLINGIWREAVLSYGFYFLAMMVLSGAALAHTNNDQHTVASDILVYLKSFWGYIAFPLGFMLAHSLRIIKYFYLKEILEKPKYLEIIYGTARHGELLNTAPTNTSGS